MNIDARESLAGKLAEVVLTPVNVRLAKQAIDMLDVRPEHVVLAAGCGRGEVIQLLAERAWSGHVVGIEPVGRLLEMARSRNRAAIAVGAVELSPGEVTSLPWPDGSFDRACAINVLYLWPSLEDALIELRRVLQAGGRLVIALRARDDGGTLAWRSATGRRGVEEIESALIDAGFVQVERSVHRIGPASAVSIAANAAPRATQAGRQAQSALRQERSQSTSR